MHARCIRCTANGLVEMVLASLASKVNALRCDAVEVCVANDRMQFQRFEEAEEEEAQEDVRWVTRPVTDRVSVCLYTSSAMTYLRWH